MDNNNPNFLNNSALIVPFGEIEETFLNNLASVLRKQFNVKFIINKPAKIPHEAYNPVRNQYLSIRILEKLHDFDGSKVLGVIEKDMYDKGLNYVFGQAEAPGRCGVISITRLRQQFYGKEKDDKILFERVVKEAVHEVGHMYGLSHCEYENCVMYFSNSIVDTDKKKSSFCNNCLKILEK